MAAKDVKFNTNARDPYACRGRHIRARLRQSPTPGPQRPLTS